MFRLSKCIGSTSPKWAPWVLSLPWAPLGWWLGEESALPGHLGGGYWFLKLVRVKAGWDHSGALVSESPYTTASNVTNNLICGSNLPSFMRLWSLPSHIAESGWNPFVLNERSLSITMKIGSLLCLCGVSAFCHYPEFGHYIIPGEGVNLLQYPNW